jgi:hypothetical protein
MLSFKQTIKEDSIVNASQKGSFIYVYGVHGILTTIALTGNERLIGFTSSNINVKGNGLIYIYDLNGLITDVIPENLNEINDSVLGTEAESGTVHNANHTHLKAAIDDAYQNQARFVIHPDNTLSVTAHGLHRNMARNPDEEKSMYRDRKTIFGYAGKENGKYYFGGITKTPLGSDEANHSLFKRFEKHGLKRGIVTVHRGVRAPTGTEKPGIEEALLLSFKSFINEGKVHQFEIVNKYLNVPKQVRVYENPTREQTKHLHNEVTATEPNGKIRTIKHGINHYAWNASKAIHNSVANALSIPEPPSENRAFIEVKHFPKHNFDIQALHSKFNDSARDRGISSEESEEGGGDYLDNLLNKFKNRGKSNDEV